jgi:hypothetical protein
MKINLQPVGTLLIGYGLALFTKGEKMDYMIGGFVCLLGLAITFSWVKEEKE